MADHLDTLEVSANYKAYCLSASLPSYYESIFSLWQCRSMVPLQSMKLNLVNSEVKEQGRTMSGVHTDRAWD